MAVTYKIYVNGRLTKHTVNDPSNTINISLPETEIHEAATVSFSVNSAKKGGIDGVAVDDISRTIYVNLQPRKKIVIVAEPRDNDYARIITNATSPNDNADNDERDDDAEEDESIASPGDDEPEQSESHLLRNLLIIVFLLGLSFITGFYFGIQHQIKSELGETQSGLISDDGTPHVVLSNPKEVPVPVPTETATPTNSAGQPDSEEKAPDLTQTEIQTVTTPAQEAEANAAASAALAQLTSMTFAFDDLPGIKTYISNPAVSEQLQSAIAHYVSMHELAIKSMRSPNPESYKHSLLEVAAKVRADFPKLSNYLLSRIIRMDNGRPVPLSDDEIMRHFNHDRRAQSYR